jgi:hypothetical protein
LELQFTVQDADVFTVPWSARIIYQRPLGDWPEMICAENPHRGGAVWVIRRIASIERSQQDGKIFYPTSDVLRVCGARTLLLQLSDPLCDGQSITLGPHRI